MISVSFGQIVIKNFLYRSIRFWQKRRFIIRMQETDFPVSCIRHTETHKALWLHQV